MKPVTALRILIVVQVLSALMGTYAEVTLLPPLPAEFQAFLLNEFGGTYVISGASLLAYSGVSLAVALAASVGLWFLKRWARIMYTVLIFATLVTTPFLGPAVTPALASALYLVSGLASGGILGLVWFSELRGSFEAKA